MSTPTQTFTLGFADALPADEAIARWITCLAMAWNDIVFTHDLFVEHAEGSRGQYLVRVAAGHLSEVFDPKGPFAAGYEDWQEVRGFVELLPRAAREDFAWLRGSMQERSTVGSLGWRLERMRNHVFHYPHLHAGQSGGARLEITRMLRLKGPEDGSITITAGSIRGTRLGFADEVSVSLAFDKAQIDATDPTALEAFTKQLLEAQQRFIRFGEIAIDRYLRDLPAGTLRVENASLELGEAAPS